MRCGGGYWELVYEADFLECSYGFRPGRSTCMALAELRATIRAETTQWIVEADIQGFVAAVADRH